MDVPDITLPAWLLGVLIVFGGFIWQIAQNILGNLLTPKAGQVVEAINTKVYLQRSRFGDRVTRFRAKRELRRVSGVIQRYDFNVELSENQDRLLEYLATTLVILIWHIFQALFFGLMWLYALVADGEVAFSIPIVDTIVGWSRLAVYLIGMVGTWYTLSNALSTCKDTLRTVLRVTMMRREPNERDENKKFLVEMREFEDVLITVIHQLDKRISGQVIETGETVDNDIPDNVDSETGEAAESTEGKSL